MQTQGLLTSVPLAGFTLIAFFLPDALFWAVYGGVLTAGTAFAASWPGRARRGAIVGILESGGARFDISAALAEYDVDDNDEPDWF